MEREDDPAPDVTDLWTAKHIIAGLRREIAAQHAGAGPGPNQYWVSLTDADAGRVRWLYEQRRLCAEQRADPGFEFFDAFLEFISESIDWAYGLAVEDSGGYTPPPAHAPPMA